MYVYVCMRVRVNVYVCDIPMYVCMYVCMYGWMDGWMDVRVYGCMCKGHAYWCRLRCSGLTFHFHQPQSHQVSHKAYQQKSLALPSGNYSRLPCLGSGVCYSPSCRILFTFARNLR